MMTNRARVRNNAKFIIHRTIKPCGLPKRCIQVRSNKDDLKAAMKECIQNFASMTTIPGIFQIVASPRPLSKLLWICALAGGIFLTLFQSKSLYDDYYKRKTIQVQDWLFPDVVEFPAVTICTHNPFINWTKVVEEKHDMVNRMEIALAECSNLTTLDKYHCVEPALMNELNKLNETERYRLGISKQDFIVECVWEDKDYTRELLQFNNLYYGNCFTFNHGLNGTAPLNGTTSSVLSFVVKIDFSIWYEHIFRDKGIAVLIHSAGTAPVLQLDSTAIIYPGYRSKFSVSQKLVERLKDPYPSNCIDTLQDEAHLKAGYYYSSGWPYAYSTEACMRSCIQRKTVSACLCTNEPKTPFDKSYNDGSILQNVSICPAGVCENILPISEMESCDCPLPCNELVFEYKYSSGREWLHNADLVERGHEIIMAEVLFGTSYIEVITEHPLFSEAEFLSNIGGNIGLCLGISLLSVIEIFELCFYIVKTSCLALCMKLLQKRTIK